jgi:hypothetical protein
MAFQKGLLGVESFLYIWDFLQRVLALMLKDLIFYQSRSLLYYDFVSYR